MKRHRSPTAQNARFCVPVAKRVTDRLRVLHFAPERIFEDWLASRPNLEYVSADLERERATVKADITAPPFPDESFEVILCSHVLEHVLDDRRAMRELYRVLRPLGWALVLVPIDFDRDETHEDASIVTPNRSRARLRASRPRARVRGATSRPGWRKRASPCGSRTSRASSESRRPGGTVCGLAAPTFLCLKNQAGRR
jgi:SAM-dependent methyltransferase